MKNLLKYLLLVVLSLHTSNFFGQQHSISIVELHVESLGNLKAKYDSKDISINQYGFGLSISAGKEYFQLIVEYNYRKIDLKNLMLPGVKSTPINEFYIGFRYYPMRPTIMLGNMAIRITAGTEGGMDMEPNWRLLFFSGLAFSQIRSTSGLSLNFVYRPGTLPSSGYLFEPSYTIRLGIILGPSAN